MEMYCDAVERVKISLVTTQQEVLCLLSKTSSNDLYRDGDLKLKKSQS
jgi:hypothetical protein